MKLIKDFDKLMKFAQEGVGAAVAPDQGDGSFNTPNPDSDIEKTGGSPSTSTVTSPTGGGRLGGGAGNAPGGGVKSGGPIDWTTTPSSPEEAQEGLPARQNTGDGSSSKIFVRTNDELIDKVREAERNYQKSQDRVYEAHENLDAAYSMPTEPILDENGKVIGHNDGPRNQAIEEAKSRLYEAEKDMVQSRNALDMAENDLRVLEPNVPPNTNSSSSTKFVRTNDEFTDKVIEAERNYQESLDRVHEAHENLTAAYSTPLEPILDENGKIIGYNDGPRNQAIEEAKSRLDEAERDMVQSRDALDLAKSDLIAVQPNISSSSRGEIEEALRNTEIAIEENNKTLNQFKEELEQKKIEMQQLQQQLAQAQQQLAQANAMSCTPIPCPDETYR